MKSTVFNVFAGEDCVPSTPLVLPAQSALVSATYFNNNNNNNNFKLIL